jgi:hypothetical protein
MKEFLISVLSALVLSCIFFSVASSMGILANMPPYPYPTRIGEVTSAVPGFGCKREDCCIPELELTNGIRPTMYITDVTDKGDRTNAEFPWGANN